MARQEKYELTDCDKRLAAAVREVHRTYGSNIQKFFEDARKAIEKQRLERESLEAVQPAGTRSEDYQKQEPLVEFEQYTKRGATVCIRRSVVAGVSAVNVEITNIRDKSGGNFYVAHPIDEVLRRLQIEVERKPIKQPQKPLKRPKKA